MGSVGAMGATGAAGTTGAVGATGGVGAVGASENERGRQNFLPRTVQQELVAATGTKGAA